ncbi:type II secretion system protein N [Hyphomonas sp.]|uniref:type II secretion system protein N n=1 Tax=Hyphomonas sp. TaxID=87 RepID=UPI0030F75E81
MSQLDILSTKALHLLPRLRVGVTVVFVALLGLLVARFVWLLVEPGGAVSAPLPLPATQTDASAGSSLASADLMILTRSNRFGRAAAVGDIIPDAPATSLNLTLKGVRSVAEGTSEASPGQFSIAIIQTPDGRALTYHPGDTIIEGVTLDRVRPDRVLIRKSGSLETLMMESGIDALSVLSLPGQEGMVEGAPRSLTTAREQAPIDRALLASLDVAPVFTDGVLVGYRLSTPESTAALSGSGLESGDIITVLDGTPIRDIKIENIAERLSNAAELSMTVQRNGADVPVTLRFPEGE